ncbi:hypothetical protein N8953_00475 [Candidatus Pelagibacter sp.]|nr:hypothetical protein [Candidatus Pelagibacter sp.]
MGCWNFRVFTIAQFPLIFEEKEKKNKASLEKNLTFDKDIPRTIERSIALVIGALNIHLGLNKIKGKIVKISKVKNKKTEFRTDKENYLLSISFFKSLLVLEICNCVAFFLTIQT